MAVALPAARFVGVDAAPGAIVRGRDLVAALGLANVTLEARAIEDYEPQTFDYVIAHGVYSWVQSAARDRLLGLCRAALAPDGVAYVSYNALPGGRALQALRDMLRFHTAALEDPHERIAEGRALLRFLVEGAPADELRARAGELLERSDASLLHDDLAEVNDPVYFHEFVAHAAQHGLRYLAEADFFEMQIGAASEPAADALLGVEDPVRREQYLDFLKGRMFRQTLLVPAERDVDRTPRPQVIEGLAVSTQVQRRGELFEGPAGSTLTTDHPVVVAALERAAAAWPAAVWVRELAAPGADTAVLCDALLRAYAANLVALHVHPPAVATTPGAAPRASPLARHQAQAGALVTNLRHVSVRIEDDLGRRLITLLDGTRDRDALAAELGAFIAERGERMPEAQLREGLERSLQGLARLALLQD
jgi:SAM-dependent methyltransferase